MFYFLSLNFVPKKKRINLFKVIIYIIIGKPLTV